MAGITEIRTRIDSVQQTLKITNAMYLISSSKLRKARQQLAHVQPFYERIRETIADHPYREYYGDTWGVELSHKVAPYYEKVAREEGCAFFNAAEYITVSPIDGLHLDKEGHCRFAELMSGEVHRLLD